MRVKMPKSSSHWKTAKDPKTGRTYYYHEVTRETQWRKPTELASEKEKRAMEEKERKQKDFFSAMEANILNSLSQGELPGNVSPRELERRKSSRVPAERPEMVRTISTMDGLVLKNLIQRQPSFRNMKKGSLSKDKSLNAAEFGSLRRQSSDITASQFESFVSIVSDKKERLDPLQESIISTDDSSMPGLFNYLPDDKEYDLDDSMHTNGDSTARSIGGRLNESSISGFGLTWEETQALKKLASIAKEMIDSESEVTDVEPSELLESAGHTPSMISRDTKGKRNLPREIELDDSDEEDDDDDDDDDVSTGDDDSETERQKNAAAFQKAKDIGGRELDFDDSDADDDDDDDDEESDLAPTPMKTRQTAGKKNTPNVKQDIVAKRPDIKRRNTCGTLFVGTTMSAPDKDANIKCVCGVLRTHILSSEQLPLDLLGDINFRVFNDHESHQTARSSGKNRDLTTRRPPVPSLEEVTKFYRDIFYKAQMESDCIIMSLIYVERLVKKTGGKVRPRAENWRSLLFSCMILSSKVWDDLSMWNVDFSQSCPPGVSFSLQRINELELAVLNALGFQVKVPASEYAKYYFLLRSMLIKSGLGGDKHVTMDPLDVMAARQLQQVSSQFENLNLAKPGTLAQRSQSVSYLQVQSGKQKLGLEQVVKM